MRYYGGKSIHGKHIFTEITRYINKLGITNYTYIEPFCGALGLLKYFAKLQCEKNQVTNIYANDISTDLILLWKKVQLGKFENPMITSKKWEELKISKPSAERAFAGFGCSFGGVWFNGYAADNDMTYSSIMKIKDYIRNVKFSNLDYEKFIDIVIEKWKERNSKLPPKEKDFLVIYMDPPYKGTCNNPFQSFDHDKFWKLVEKYSKIKNVVIFITEFSCMKIRGIKLINSFERRSGMHNTSENNILKENIYVVTN